MAWRQKIKPFLPDGLLDHPVVIIFRIKKESDYRFVDLMLPRQGYAS
jgi:hypothetical protein